MPELIDPVRGDETRQTWTDENGLLHIQGTIDYHGSGFRMPARNASSGGHLASLAPTCSQNGSDAPVTYNTVCGGGCITQYQKWSVNLYYNDADPSNLYYQRLEVRVWWVREGSTYINWSGSATSTFREIMLKCDGSLWSRDTYSSWSPSWYTDWRSYDYYWNETWMPIMGGPGDKHMVVFTDTPTNYGVNLYTQQVFN